MPAQRRRKKVASLSRMTTELSVAVPMVVAHRTTRMMLAGPFPSQRDQQEFMLMVSEKPLAFGQAWWVMTIRSMLASQGVLESMLHLAWSPWIPGALSPKASAERLGEAVLDVAIGGLTPVHRKVVENSRRLTGPRPHRPGKDGDRYR